MTHFQKLFLVAIVSIALAFPASAATPQAVDSPVFLAQVASVLETIQKTLASLAAAIQNLGSDAGATTNAVNKTATPQMSPPPAPTPKPSPSPVAPTPPPSAEQSRAVGTSFLHYLLGNQRKISISRQSNCGAQFTGTTREVCDILKASK